MLADTTSEILSRVKVLEHGSPVPNSVSPHARPLAALCHAGVASVPLFLLCWICPKIFDAALMQLLYHFQPVLVHWKLLIPM